MGERDDDADLDRLTDEQLQERLRACEEKLNQLRAEYAESLCVNRPGSSS